jgi:hypothetical protein
MNGKGCGRMWIEGRKWKVDGWRVLDVGCGGEKARSSNIEIETVLAG